MLAKEDFQRFGQHDLARNRFLAHGASDEEIGCCFLEHDVCRANFDQVYSRDSHHTRS